MTWERARQPAQKSKRRDALLRAAADLFEEKGLAGVTLSGVAATAGMAKSNVYRYFESLDAILLALLLDDMSAWADEVAQALAPLAGSGDIDTVAQAFAGTLVGAPRMCALSGLGRMVLERQISTEAMGAFKAESWGHIEDAAREVAGALPELGIERAVTFVSYTNMFLGQAWPSSHLSPAAEAARAELEPGVSPLAFGAIMQHVMCLLLRGLHHTP